MELNLYIVRSLIMTHATTHNRIKAITLTTLLATGGFQIGSAFPAVIEAQAAMTEAPSRLSLNVTEYDVIGGQIMVALYAEEDSFNSEAKPFRDAIVRVTGPETTIIFNDLPVGEYAFKIYHDEDGDGELDTGILGIPSEPYFFSTDASDPFSAPEWEESRFLLPLGKMTRNVSLN